MGIGRWCNNCKKIVYPEKVINNKILGVSLLFGIIPGISYYLLKEKVCPDCGKADWNTDK